MVTLYSLLYEDVDIEIVMEANPIASLVQGFHTRKILKGMTPDERKELGKFLRDKDFIEMSRQYHTAGANRPYDIQRFIKQRIDDPKLAKKITTVALDPKFDQARNRLVTKMLVPKDTLPKSDEPLKITPTAQKTIDRDAAAEQKKQQITTWLKTATVKNPSTGRTILVRSGLQSDPESDVYKASHAALDAQRKTLKMRPIKPRVKPTKEPTTQGTPNSQKPSKSSKFTPTPSHKPSYSSPSYSNPSSAGGFSFGGGGGFSGGGGGSSF